jgi:adenylate kinase
MNIILLGMPGAGKGTQAEILVKNLGLEMMQSGELSRDWAAKDERIAKIVRSGKLIPEKEMTDYVLGYLEKNIPEADNILFEGWPRFITQYQDLEKWLKKKGKSIDAIVFLEIDEDIVIKRLSSRRICSKCGEIYNLITNAPKKKNACDKCGGKLRRRKDDNPKSIKIRFEYYRNNTGKLVDYLRKNKDVIVVDADRPIEVISEDVIARLKEKNVH